MHCNERRLLLGWFKSGSGILLKMSRAAEGNFPISVLPFRDLCPRQEIVQFILPAHITFREASVSAMQDGGKHRKGSRRIYTRKSPRDCLGRRGNSS